MTAILTAVTISVLTLWLVAERFRPAFQRSGGVRRIFRNIGLGVAGTLTTFLVVTPVSLAAAQVGPGWRGDWPLALRLGADLVVLELFIYWWHRALHEVSALWRFHRVHHYDTFLDVTSALRFHPGEMVISAFLRGTLIVLFDVSVLAILLFDAFVIIAAGFHHSNISLPRRIDDRLRRVIVSPRHHRIHHIPEQQYTDSNYGTLLTVWDRLFRSYQDPETVGSYGVAGHRDKPLPRLMTDPFRNQRDPDDDRNPTPPENLR